MSKPFDFGRVFFPRKDERSIPEYILFQPLGNHVSNVRKLVWHWKLDDFSKFESECKVARKRVSDAAGLHDIGKPQRFSVNVKISANGKIEFGYSFRGHRFLATAPTQPWVEALAQGHHDFTAHDICRDTYKLKTLSNKLDESDPLTHEAAIYKQSLELDPMAYAHELYILEMCDQIEAEIACRFFEEIFLFEENDRVESEQAESRAFMDFTITRNKRDFLIDPWVLSNRQKPIELTVSYWAMPFPLEVKLALENGSKDSQALTKKLNQAVNEWWQAQPKGLKSKPEKIAIKQRPNDLSKNFATQAIYDSVGRFLPNPMQQALITALDPVNHPSILLKAPTGSGKTESVLFPALANNYRLFLVLPTRSLLEDQRERIHDYLLRFSNLEANKDREISLVVDTGAQMDRWLYVNGQDSKPKVRSRRHLYKGNIILTTLDKFLYRYFAFGDKQKSFIFPHRIHFSNSLICFDEAHSYDQISFTNFQSLVQSLYQAGRSLILMTATMPKELSQRFDYLDKIDFIDDAELSEKLNQFQQQTLKRPYQSQRAFEWMSDLQRNQESPEAFQQVFAQIICQEWEQSNKNRRILAVVETVRDAAAIYQQLKAQLAADTQSNDLYLFLYHGRIADKLRPDLYKQIKQRDDEGKSYILITTSAIEVGCDLNAEVLISQICPPENLIQRAGRCNRKGDVKDAKVILIGDRIPDFANSLDEKGWQNYQNVLQSLQSLAKFDAKEIGTCISRSQHIDDYRVVELFSMLHDYVYRADLTCQPTYEKGLVVTRSWTPSATLFYDDGGHGDWSKDLSKFPQISIPLDRLTKERDESNLYASVDVYERYYDQEETRRRERPLTWGSAYQKDIVVRIGKSDGTQPEMPYTYDSELGFVQLPGVFTKWRSKEADQKLEYKPTKNSKSSVITYIKPLSLEPTVEQIENATQSHSQPAAT